jgi:hypothetical protein
MTDVSDDIDKTASCRICRGDIEHYEGVPGSEFMTPFWRHIDASAVSRPHPAVPDPATVREVSR